jgi:hypothetical protein
VSNMSEEGRSHGNITLEDMLQHCSRHKSKWVPPGTPDGFWDLTIHSPQKWG